MKTAIKITGSPLCYKHYAAAIPSPEATTFPFLWLAKYRCMPRKETDSHKMTAEPTKPVALLRYGSSILQHWKKQETLNGWTLIPCSEVDLRQILEGARTTTLPDFGVKMPTTLKYVQAAIATPQRAREFPLDMLRYDRCIPYSEQDTTEISHPDGKPVAVYQYLNTTMHHLTPARWASFGWQISPINWYDLERKRNP